jgi:hypothetical protein
MALLDQTLRLFHNVHPALLLAIVPVTVILVHFIPWLVDPHGLRSFPGPWVARFSDLWLGRVAQQGHRSEVVHQMHEKYGELAKGFPFCGSIRANIHIPLFTPLFSRDVRPHRPEPPIHIGSHGTPNRLRARKWLAKV